MDVLNEMERASVRLLDAGLHGDLSLDEAAEAVADLIEAAHDVDRRAGPDRELKLRAALARVRGTK
ncbi:hypothetical protein ACS9ZL_08515 [Stenotrophomonas africana]